MYTGGTKHVLIGGTLGKEFVVLICSDEKNYW